MEFHPQTNSEHTRIPASARRMPRAEGCRCESEDGVVDGVVVVVVDVVAAVVVVSDVKILTIKITHSACTFIHPLNEGWGPELKNTYLPI